jgi:hypothetical protein
MIRNHSALCNAGIAEYAWRVWEFQAEHPHYCQCCNARGFTFGPGEPWFGGTDFDPCPDCAEKNLCPRCRKSLGENFDWDNPICPHCGWRDPHAGGEAWIDYIPERPECRCVVVTCRQSDGILYVQEGDAMTSPMNGQQFFVDGINEVPVPSSCNGVRRLFHLRGNSYYHEYAPDWTPRMQLDTNGLAVYRHQLVRITSLMLDQAKVTFVHQHDRADVVPIVDLIPVKGSMP